MIMLQKHVYMSNTFSVFMIANQAYTNRIIAAYHKSKHILLARETFSRKISNYSEDMPANQKDRYIHYLVDKVNELDLDKRAMELAVEEFQGIHNNVLEQLAELQRSIAEIKTDLHEERGKRKRAEAKTCKLNQQLKYLRKNKFGAE